MLIQILIKKGIKNHILLVQMLIQYILQQCYKLPYGEPKFDNGISKYTINHILNLDPQGDYGYIFNVDLHYPCKLHDRDDEFPILCDLSIPPNDKTKN